MGGDGWRWVAMGGDGWRWVAMDGGKMMEERKGIGMFIDAGWVDGGKRRYAENFLEEWKVMES